MDSFRMLVVTAAMVPYLTLVAVAEDCQKELLLHQRRDTATIDRLERMWTLAYVHGDTDLERCILAPDFTEIMRNGHVKFLRDELRFAENNKGKRLELRTPRRVQSYCTEPLQLRTVHRHRNPLTELCVRLDTRTITCEKADCGMPSLRLFRCIHSRCILASWAAVAA
jgi:hypothetical protein